MLTKDTVVSLRGETLPIVELVLEGTSQRLPRKSVELRCCIHQIQKIYVLDRQDMLLKVKEKALALLECQLR